MADVSDIERVIMSGDLSKLTPDQRISYYRDVCQSVGLNPLTRPFDYITLSGKLTLYAKKDCTDQLRKLNGVSIEVVARERIDDLYVVTARATTPSGRRDEEIGAVMIGNLRGESLANALMKATTKAKRRVTLSICGLGMLDETEVETIHDAQVVDMPMSALEQPRRDGNPPKPAPERPAPEPEQPHEDGEPEMPENEPMTPEIRAAAVARYHELAKIATDQQHEKAAAINAIDPSAIADMALKVYVTKLESMFAAPVE
jgi:hypothetical protein